MSLSLCQDATARGGLVPTGRGGACSRRCCLSILLICWSCGRIANAATGTSTRHPWTCLSARTSAPGAGTARRTSCTGSVRIAAASSSDAPSAQPACSPSIRPRPSGRSGQGALHSADHDHRVLTITCISTMCGHLARYRVEDLLPQDVCVPAVLGEFAQHVEVDPAQRERAAPVAVDPVVQPQGRRRTP